MTLTEKFKLDGLYLFIGAVLLRIVRAKIEERKFLRTLPEYEDYTINPNNGWICT